MKFIVFIKHNLNALLMITILVLLIIIFRKVMREGNQDPEIPDNFDPMKAIENPVTADATDYHNDRKLLCEWTIENNNHAEILNTVKQIGSQAFSGCTTLMTVTIPPSVTSIASYAFAGCRSLTNVAIPSSVISIGLSAFAACKSLTTITIPDSVTSIGTGAFHGCTTLNKIIITTNRSTNDFETIKDDMMDLVKATGFNTDSISVVISSSKALDWFVPYTKHNEFYKDIKKKCRNMFNGKKEKRCKRCSKKCNKKYKKCKKRKSKQECNVSALSCDAECNDKFGLRLTTLTQSNA